MSIFPLPVFEADADAHHRTELTNQEIYEKLEPPKSIVVKFGAMRVVGEYPYDGAARPGCGTKLVVRTHRGTEMGEMLTTTCENAGCGKSVTRQELRGFIDESGGKDFPFYSNGKILRVATIEDLNKQSSLDLEKPRYLRECKAHVDELELKMRLVDVEPILGGELLTFYYMAEERVDFRELVRLLAGTFKTRIEMRQVGARDEARLVADYERCGQYCCCKGFLKVLRPVSMKSAKVQKATLDPLKISGRCGRLMCCLRYEDATYKELKQRLPRKNTRVGTAEGPGVIIDGKILVQLVLVRLEDDGREIAVPVEELMDPETCPTAEEAREAELAKADPLRGMAAEKVAKKAAEKAAEGETPPQRRKKRRRRRRRKGGEAGDKPAGAETARKDAGETGQAGDGQPKKKRRSRRRGGRRRRGRGGSTGEGGGKSEG